MIGGTMKPIKFIHTGDLHLGQRIHYATEPPKEIQEALSNAVFESFVKLCKTAQQEAVDFLLIAGDVYDSVSRSVKANQFFIQQCKQLNFYNIAIYVIAGNHDPLIEGQELFNLPENVHIFDSKKPESIEHRRNGEAIALIIGQSYQRKWEQRKMHQDYDVLASELPTIAMLHTQLSLSEQHYVPASVTELVSQTAIDYWALGHIHQQRIIQGVHPVIAYCGTPQGCDFGECGRGGALMVEMATKTDINITPIDLASVNIIEETIDISDKGYTTLSDLEACLLEKTNQIQQQQGDERGKLVRWRIQGKSELKKVIEEKEQAEVELTLLQLLNEQSGIDNRDFIWHDAIHFHLQRPVDYTALKAQNTIYLDIETLTDQWADAGLNDAHVMTMGKIWSLEAKEEGLKGKQLTMNELLYQDIIRDASKLVMEALAERRMSDED
jgi:DNA repair exonuclease SbcCD nuclease subunit